jgi:hypothetical protein
VLALATLFVVAMAQLPNLVNMWWGFGRHHTGAPAPAPHRLERLSRPLHLLIPIGWLPYGVGAAARGDLVPALLGTLGEVAIGAASLRRAYRTTLRLYTGQFTSARPPEPAPGQAVSARRPESAGLVARRVPGLREPAAAVATASLRSLLRTPELRILLIGPLMVLVLGVTFVGRHGPLPEAARPFAGFGAFSFVQLTLVQLLMNQFGLDRAGFRLWVLSPVARRDILLGKNLSIAPILAALGLPGLVVVQFLAGAGPTHFLANLAAAASLFLLVCIIGNWASILLPQPVASGSLKPAHPKAAQILAQLGTVMLFPILAGITLIPLGIELLVETRWPLSLVGSAAELAILIFAYRQALAAQGRALAARETRILAAVTENLE